MTAYLEVISTDNLAQSSGSPAKRAFERGRAPEEGSKEWLAGTRSGSAISEQRHPDSHQLPKHGLDESILPFVSVKE
jgi:hypothetical protein